MNKEYTPEQIEDVKKREVMGIQALKDLELTPAAILNKVNLGEDVFADKVTPFLQDTKYAKKDEPTPTAQESVEAK